MDNLTWQGNSKAMYDAVLREVPAFLSSIVRKSIDNWIRKNNISTVTEDLVFKAVADIAPPDIAQSRIYPALEKMRTP